MASSSGERRRKPTRHTAATAATMAEASHPRPEKLPSCHSRMRWLYSGLATETVLMSAFVNRLSTMPVRMIVLFESERSSREERKMAIPTVARPKARLTAGSASVPSAPAPRPDTITSAAPSPAPEDTPRPYGLASGFLSTDCITTPPIAAAAPAANESVTRGRRMFSTRPGVTLEKVLRQGRAEEPVREHAADVRRADEHAADPRARKEGQHGGEDDDPRLRARPHTPSYRSG